MQHHREDQTPRRMGNISGVFGDENVFNRGMEVYKTTKWRMFFDKAPGRIGIATQIMQVGILIHPV